MSTTNEITTNDEQRLFVIPCGSGYTCLGYDVCAGRIAAYAADLGIDPAKYEIGTLEQYRIYSSLSELLRLRFEKDGTRSSAELTPQLIGLEGKRVEVVDAYGEKRRFKVGKSTGWVPCHLELKRRDSHGGMAVMGAPFQSVRVID